ncbi:EAL domain-containing protein [Marinomonas ostreistagni]|uniref:EAL domain-containing protein n=1 Tax=Marinomonas ostreistagni TaxID=359209 RepID=UPI0019525528|nr:EAL domain-containing protein [Marinomonas ostreistagni]MBM6551072.1 EAL domain-containing protein [Marinomonas ostreistagni]
MTTQSKPQVSPTNYRTFFITIGFISALVFIWARTSFNHYQVNLLDVNNARVLPIGSALLESYSVGSDRSDVMAACVVTEESWVSRCGLSLLLPQDEDGQAFSFNKIDTLHATFDTMTPVPGLGDGLRLTIKTPFEGTTVEPVNDAGFKLHSVRLENGQFDIPLSRIDVDTDWQDVHDVSFADADKDFSQVHSLDITFNETPLITPGRYELVISELMVDGHRVELATLNNWLLTFWLFIGVGGILHLAWRDQGSLQRMRRVALYDADTDLLNEQGIKDYVKGLAPEADGSVYLFRFDNASILERHFGTKIYTQLLNKTKQRLQSVFQSHSVRLVRLSHNEFMMLCPQGRLSNESLLERIFREGVEVVGVGHLKLDASASFVFQPALSKLMHSAIEKARFMIDQPRHPNNFVRVYSDSDLAPLKQKATVEEALRRAIANDEFYLQFMPLYDARAQRVIGAEALLRSTSDSLSKLSPEVYIPVAEKANLIQEIDMLVIQKALAALTQHNLPDDFVLSINISAQELLDSEFAKRIRRALNYANVAPERICLEVTETFFVHMDDAKVEVLEELRELGCRVSLDDFGTGYTSFAHLQRLSVDEIKIDRSFVNRLDDPKARVVVESMVNIAQTLDYNLVAEGVETAEQLEYLKCLGCRCFQGYYFSKPTSLKDAAQAYQPAGGNENYVI